MKTLNGKRREGKVHQIMKEVYAKRGQRSWSWGGNEEMKFTKAEYKGENIVGENNQKCN